jgi:hypothetical protein
MNLVDRQQAVRAARLWNGRPPRRYVPKRSLSTVF